MWTRAELKENAKMILQRSYWESFVAYLVYGAISIGCSLIAYVVPFGSILGTLFLILPLSVGLNFFFMQNQIAPSKMPSIFYAFRSGAYIKIVGSMAWMYLFLVLWSMIGVIGFFILIFKSISSIIPAFMTDSFMTNWQTIDGSQQLFDGILSTIDSSWIPALVVSGIIYIAGLLISYIKSLSYSMTAFILTDNPYIGYERALKLSIAMTDGQKWKMFVLGLSFLGWGLLALLTLGIGFLFLSPYIASTNAQLYVKLRDHAINCGLTSPQELNVYQK